MVSLSVDLAPGNPRELRLANPVVAASGCFGFGLEYSGVVDVERLGAFVSTSVTLRPRSGNPMPRITETPAGTLSAIGLHNPGLRAFVRKYPQIWSSLRVPAIVSVAGDSIEEFVEIVGALDDLPGIAAIELNLTWGYGPTAQPHIDWSPDLTSDVVNEVRQSTSLPIIAKLGLGPVDSVEVATAAEKAGADAITLTGVIEGMAIDVVRRRPLLARGTGRLSGPAIRPIAVKLISDVSIAVSVPVMGGGGVACLSDVLEFLMAGASAVQVGAAIMIQPGILTRLIDELEGWMTGNGVEHLADIIGSAQSVIGLVESEISDPAPAGDAG